MSGPGDGGEVSRDEAAWRDLIARFDAPAVRTAAGVPWPAREDLHDPDSPAEPPAGTAEQSASDASRSGSGEAQGRTGETQGRTGETQGRASETHGRAGETQGRASETHGSTSNAPSRPTDAPGPGSHPAGWTADAPAASDPFAGPTISFAIPVDRTRVIRPAGLPRSYTPPEEAEEPYVPAPLPPPGKLDSVSKAAIAGVIGGPGYLLIASIFLHWSISAGAALIAVAAFIAGFVTLVVKLGDRSHRDDDDDGAVL